MYNHLHVHLFHPFKKDIHSFLQSQINAALQLTEEHLEIYSKKKPRGQTLWLLP